EAVIIASIAALALGVAWLVRLLAGTRLGGIVLETGHAKARLPLRITVVLLVGLLLVTQEFGVEAALGAFFAGIVLRLAANSAEAEVFDDKLDTVGYGVFIPVFFIASGMALDIESIVENPLRLLVF